LIVWVWALIKTPWLKAIPSPLVVLVTVIPLANFFDLSMVYRLRFNFEFSELWQFKIPLVAPTSWWLFFKYVGLFAIIGSLESLLTVNAIQGLRPDIKPNKDQDLIAVGMGNMLASAFGGLPMISEVARSSANIHNGAKTHWANFFHGFFILMFMVFSSFFNELIPLSALAAMLVTVGIRLANPKVLINLKSSGIEHISGFLVTLIGCLAIDLLWGLALGTLAQIAVARLMQIKNA
jgi:MFS superfamily sulfate permease-like transporter